jgi:hypothetical protein
VYIFSPGDPGAGRECVGEEGEAEAAFFSITFSHPSPSSLVSPGDAGAGCGGRECVGEEGEAEAALGPLAPPNFDPAGCGLAKGNPGARHAAAAGV